MARPGRPKMPKAPLPGTVDAFLDMLIAERGAALNTRHAYERDLADVCAFLKKQSKDINSATTNDLKAYLGELGARENAKSKGGTVAGWSPDFSNRFRSRSRATI